MKFLASLLFLATLSSNVYAGNLKLYYTPGACSLAVRILINEIGIKADYEKVDLATHKTSSGEDFYKISDKGAVPTIITKDGKLLTENAVILQYLADSNNKTTLLSRDFKRYKTLEMVNFVSTEIHKGFAPLFNQDLNQSAKDIFIKKLRLKFEYADKILANSKYIAGKDFTIADAYFFVTTTWMKYANIEIKDFPNIERYITELSSRQSIKRSLSEEGLA
jgi:glutathione S-transferase